jgi:hypothetical protein
MPAVVTTTLSPDKGCCNVCLRSQHRHGLRFVTKHNTHGTGKNRTDRIFVCWFCLSRVGPNNSATCQWFRDHEGQLVEFSAGGALSHRGRVLKAAPEFVEMDVLGDGVSMLPYSVFTRFRAVSESDTQ